MQTSNSSIPIEVSALRDVKLSILDIQNKSNKEFEKKENIDFITFSNQYSKGSLFTYNGRINDEKVRFVKFYNSLIED